MFFDKISLIAYSKCSKCQQLSINCHVSRQNLGSSDNAENLSKIHVKAVTQFAEDNFEVMRTYHLPTARY